MADVFDKEKRSWIMSRVKSQKTKPELFLFGLIKKNFYDRKKPYRKYYKKLVGKPDIAFLKQKLAVFLDGDFWHGYRHKDWISKLPKKYWQDKILNNVKRDKKTNRLLTNEGWKVLRIWEHELKKPERVVDKIKKALKQRSRFW